MARPWTISCRRLLPPCGRPRTGCWACGPTAVQLVGGIVLHQGRIAEMKTGEGKTLVATLPAYLNALTGKGVHIVTVNDYLAKRDSEWMGKVHRFLGLKVGLIVHGLTTKRAAGRLRRGHHLWHQQRDGLRLPAGQHGHLQPRSWCSGVMPSPSWTRWTPS